MSALPSCPPAAAPEAGQAREYLVSYGKSGAFGRFCADGDFMLRRGARVVIQTSRGVELGTVLCPANAGHIQLLTSGAVGRLLRSASAAEESVASACARRADQLVNDWRRLVEKLALPIEILDADVLYDTGRAVVQYLAPSDVDVGPLADALAADWFIFFENVALQTRAEEDQSGCGKPDCGRAAGGGGCSSCGSGGCSSCGGGKVDMRRSEEHT